MVGCSDDDAGCAIDGYFSRAVMTGLVSGEDYFISVGSFVGTEDFSGPIRMVVTTP
ncbi:MAG: hypothetical protein IPK83_19875 [Planctomycetes bacterium]|nr:hypothetical protein [Planctomycetota bacterium]